MFEREAAAVAVPEDANQSMSAVAEESTRLGESSSSSFFSAFSHFIGFLLTFLAVFDETDVLIGFSAPSM